MAQRASWSVHVSSLDCRVLCQECYIQSKISYFHLPCRLCNACGIRHARLKKKMQREEENRACLSSHADHNPVATSATTTTKHWSSGSSSSLPTSSSCEAEGVQLATHRSSVYYLLNQFLANMTIYVSRDLYSLSLSLSSHANHTDHTEGVKQYITKDRQDLHNIACRVILMRERARDSSSLMCVDMLHSNK